MKTHELFSSLSGRYASLYYVKKDGSINRYHGKVAPHAPSIEGGSNPSGYVTLCLCASPEHPEGKQYRAFKVEQIRMVKTQNKVYFTNTQGEVEGEC